MYLSNPGLRKRGREASLQDRSEDLRGDGCSFEILISKVPRNFASSLGAGDSGHDQSAAAVNDYGRKTVSVIQPRARIVAGDGSIAILISWKHVEAIFTEVPSRRSCRERLPR